MYISTLKLYFCWFVCSHLYLSGALFPFVFFHSMLRSSIPIFICLRRIVCSVFPMVFKRYQKRTKSKGYKINELPFPGTIYFLESEVL